MIYIITDGSDNIVAYFYYLKSRWNGLNRFHLAYGVSRADDRRVLSGIVYMIRNGLQWKDTPKAYGPHKTLYNPFIRQSRLGVFNRIFVALTE